MIKILATVSMFCIEHILFPDSLTSIDDQVEQLKFI